MLINQSVERLKVPVVKLNCSKSKKVYKVTAWDSVAFAMRALPAELDE